MILTSEYRLSSAAREKTFRQHDGRAHDEREQGAKTMAVAQSQRARKALRDVRRLLREDIDSLGNTLLAVNMLVMPILVALLGFVIIYRRTKRSGGKR